ncbi:hypothetical protein K7X08_016640 [Anisodus acutangulus]|uniref:Uncharacterized protein n=1 Tax=Anisodus acutangulus TaxID=402998 RepID=A0A9Q1LFL3_9SOLA|nr:hypothetical protein K7X08_016640 [Anisodus acutangulus]
MNVLKICVENSHQLVPSLISSKYRNANANYLAKPLKVANRRKQMQGLSVRASSEEKQSERRSFLTIEEAGLVEVSGLSTHERFLCRLTVHYEFSLCTLTISSLNLLRVIAEQEGCSIEELNAGRVCDWFLKDKLKREQSLDSAVLQWDESDFQL